MSQPDFWQRVASYVATIDERSYYDLLSVKPGASVDEIQDAFYHMSRRLHPDRYAQEKDERRLYYLNVLYARVREAYDVLTDPRKRQQYDAGLAGGSKRFERQRGSGLIQRAPKDKKARMFFELGKRLADKGDMRGAAAQLQMALQIEPDSELIRAALAELDVPSQQQRQPQPSLRQTAAAAPSAVAQRAEVAAPRARAKAQPQQQRRSASIRVFTTLVSRSSIAPAVGIDFGTSYSSVSLGIGDKVFAVPDAYGRTLHPSVVHYPETGDPLCGWNAREKLVTSPRQTVSSPKRLLGRHYSDGTVAGLLQHASFKSSAGPNDTILIDMRSGQYAVGQVCGQVIRHARETAERSLRQRIERAVLSVPVTFDDDQREQLRRAASMAGVEVLDFVDEPVGAAMAYGFGQGKDEIVAVYDFGGGTFDFTVLDISGYSFKVISRAGDSWLGGDDFDLAIANAVADAIWRKTKVEVRDRAVEWQRLLFACERAKRQLSDAQSAMLAVDGLIEQPQRVNLRQRIGRELIERLCTELVERSLSVCRTALGQAGLDPRDMNEVIISGGVSRMPFVRRMISGFFQTSIRTTVNPDEAICLGAGFRAAQLSRFPVTGVGQL